MTHDRTVTHTGTEPETAITLAETIAQLEADEVHEVLAELDSRLAQLEGEPRFSLDAVIV